MRSACASPRLPLVKLDGAAVSLDLEPHTSSRDALAFGSQLIGLRSLSPFTRVRNGLRSFPGAAALHVLERRGHARTAKPACYCRDTILFRAGGALARLIDRSAATTDPGSALQGQLIAHSKVTSPSGRVWHVKGFAPPQGFPATRRRRVLGTTRCGAPDSLTPPPGTPDIARQASCLFPAAAAPRRPQTSSPLVPAGPPSRQFRWRGVRHQG